MGADVRMRMRMTMLQDGLHGGVRQVSIELANVVVGGNLGLDGKENITEDNTI